MRYSRCRKVSKRIHLPRRASLARVTLLCLLGAAVIFQKQQTFASSWRLQDAISAGLLQKGSEIGFLYLLFFNRSYLSLVKSFICNMYAVNPEALNHIVFVATDKRSHRALNAFDPGLKIYTHKFHIKKSVRFGTFEYYRVTLERLAVQNMLIQSGVNVMVIEADAAWFSKDVSKVITEKLRTAEIVSADDLSASPTEKKLISAGFLACKSTAKVRNLFQKYYSSYRSALMKHAGQRGEIALAGEQWLMTKILRASDINVSWLDPCQFASGKWYLEDQYRLRCPRPLVLQNNYIKGNQFKIKRAKSWGHWYLTDEGSCLS
mmetsp:Transcript_6156/g.24483  ORF Transcript_6156/g.24483 Transcript_6156/m.24483 type:complete len:320 (+) Transcript_6156:600-1559(+)